MPGLSVPLEQLRELIEEFRRAGVRSYKDPSGLEITLDTRAPIRPQPDSTADGEF